MACGLNVHDGLVQHDRLKSKMVFQKSSLHTDQYSTLGCGVSEVSSIVVVVIFLSLVFLLPDRCFILIFAKPFY